MFLSGWVFIFQGFISWSHARYRERARHFGPIGTRMRIWTPAVMLLSLGVFVSSWMNQNGPATVGTLLMLSGYAWFAYGVTGALYDIQGRIQ